MISDDLSDLVVCAEHLVSLLILVLLVLGILVDGGRVEEVEERVGLDGLGEELASVGSLLLLLLDDLLGDVLAIMPVDLVSGAALDGGSVVVIGLLELGGELERVLLLQDVVLEVRILREVEVEREAL